MKKAWLALALVALLAIPAWAGEKTLTITWTQQLPSPNDLRQWNLYSSTTAGGPYVLFATIPFVSAQAEYTTERVLTSPDGQRIQYFFVMDAEDLSGNRSGYSNEANTWIDFQAPGAPLILTITVRSAP